MYLLRAFILQTKAEQKVACVIQTLKGPPFLSILPGWKLTICVDMLVKGLN